MTLIIVNLTVELIWKKTNFLKRLTVLLSYSEVSSANCSKHKLLLTNLAQFSAGYFVVRGVVQQTNRNSPYGWEPPQMDLTSTENASIEELHDPSLTRGF